ALASAAALSFASADSSCPVTLMGRQTATTAAARANATRLAFFMTPSDGVCSSTVLRTRGDDPTVRQLVGSDQPRQRLVASAAQFQREGLVDVFLEIGLAHVADAEPRRSRTFALPALDRPLVVLDVEGHVGVRIPPV